MTTHEIYGGSAAAYALGALDVEERRAYEAHISDCPICQQELVEYRRVLAAIGAGVAPEAPSGDLKARTLGRLKVASPPPAPVPFEPRRPPAAAPGAPPASRPWAGWLTAAALLAAVGLGIYATSLRSQAETLRRMNAEASARAEVLRGELASARQEAARLNEAMEILRAPDLVPVNLVSTGAQAPPAARAYVSPSLGMVVAARGLPPLAAGRVYQLWVIPPAGAPVSAGVFQVDSTGAAAVTLPAPPGAGQLRTVAVTNEPGPAGSPAPTSTPLLAGTVGG